MPNFPFLLQITCKINVYFSRVTDNQIVNKQKFYYLYNIKDPIYLHKNHLTNPPLNGQLFVIFTAGVGVLISVGIYEK